MADGLQVLNSFDIYSWIIESQQRRHAVVRDVRGSAAVSSILFERDLRHVATRTD